MKGGRGLKEVGVGNKRWDMTIGGGMVCGEGREGTHHVVCVCVCKCHGGTQGLVVAMRSPAETPLFAVFQEFVR